MDFSDYEQPFFFSAQLFSLTIEMYAFDDTQETRLEVSHLIQCGLICYFQEGSN